MKRVFLIVIALTPALVAGCLPNATWLPDSSGFVYTGGPHKDTLYLYDLEKKEPRTLVEKGAGPAWPAVSADGKHIAVVLRLFQTAAFFPCLGRGSVTLKVIVFDRDGKESHRSPKLEWADRNPGDQDKTAPQAFWVPGQEKLLICSDGKTGIYDLKTKSVVKHDRIVSTFGASPILPDGKGFLACNNTEREGGLVAVDWDGKEKKIEPLPKDALNNFSDRDAWPLAGMIYYPLMHASHWDGSTAVVTWDGLRVKIDTDKGVGTGEQFKPSFSADKKLIQQEVRLSAGGGVRAVELCAATRRMRALATCTPAGTASRS